MIKLKRFSFIFVIILIFEILYPHIMYAANHIQSNPDGTITFDTTSTQATTGIKYRTVGFVVTLDPRCEGSQCDPRQNGSYGIIPNLQQTGEDDNGTTVTTYFTVPEALVTKALVDAGILENPIIDGGNIYLHSIFIVTGVGDDDTRYYTLSSIKHAQSWADDSGFRQYYDIEVPYRGQFPVDYVLKTDDNHPLGTGHMTNIRENSHGKWKLGEQIHSEDYHQLPAEVIIGNITYRLHKSYIESKENVDGALKRKDVIERDPVASTTPIERHFTTFVGGSNLVGIYSANSPVKAKFFSISGLPLQDPYDVGEYQTGDPASYEFPQTLTKNGVTYTITKSYIKDNTAGAQPEFIQNEGDANLRSRNMTVPAGGANFFGIYKSETCETNPDAPGCHPPPPDSQCSAPEPVGELSDEYPDPEAEAEIRADQRGNERFDVADGIPTSGIFVREYDRERIPVQVHVHQAWRCLYVPDLRHNRASSSGRRRRGRWRSRR